MHIYVCVSQIHKHIHICIDLYVCLSIHLYNRWFICLYPRFYNLTSNYLILFYVLSSSSFFINPASLLFPFSPFYSLSFFHFLSCFTFLSYFLSLTFIPLVFGLISLYLSTFQSLLFIFFSPFTFLSFFSCFLSLPFFLLFFLSLSLFFCWL